VNRQRARSELVANIDEIIANIYRLEEMRAGSAAERKFHQGRIKNGKVFVAFEHEDSLVFAPSKFAGYRENNLHHLSRLGERHGSATNARISRLLGGEIGSGHREHGRLDSAYQQYCRSAGIFPSLNPRPRRYWLVQARTIYPDEVDQGQPCVEGAKKLVAVNRYERDPRARQACLAHYGFDCSACGFNFEETYGDLGQDYIHVHHLIPIHTIGEEYEVDPIKDLRPVCPNCHAMLHRAEPCLTIESLRARLK
jgi:5-methylcytosine-specific restriction protein A